ncbi:hypothetical protein ACFQZJ_05735 [Maribacter chungangensis]|uniref:Type II toxin-antitoxin system HicA family toxin n=1 Tax=Maribacter chungangensis TaxID=1069117 RepID=A0ABW3B286_9FLAO
MGKKKPHKKKGELKQMFDAVRENSTFINSHGHDSYQLIKTKNGFTVIVSRERAEDETHHFDAEQKVRAYIKTLN